MNKGNILDKVFLEVLKEKSVQDLISKMDKETRNHSIRVGFLSSKIGKKFGLKQKELKIFIRSALLHDVGKTSIPMYVLRKGDISNKERNFIEKHPKESFEKLNKIGMIDEANVVVAHHEFQNKPYPRKDNRDSKIEKRNELKNNKSGELAELLAAIDECDSLLNKRSYKEKFSFEETKNILKEQFTGNFEIVERILKEYKKIKQN